MTWEFWDWDSLGLFGIISVVVMSDDLMMDCYYLAL